MNFDENPPPNSFRKSLKEIFKKYPNSRNDIEAELDKLKKNPLKGEIIPGFTSYQLRKIRLPLKKYKIGKRKGLRVICLVNVQEKKITLLHIYSKMQYKNEEEVIKKSKRGPQGTKRRINVTFRKGTLKFSNVLV